MLRLLDYRPIEGDTVRPSKRKKNHIKNYARVQWERKCIIPLIHVRSI